MLNFQITLISESRAVSNGENDYKAPEVTMFVSRYMTSAGYQYPVTPDLYQYPVTPDLYLCSFPRHCMGL